MSEADSSIQVELDSGKRVKVKTSHVLLRFEKPQPAELIAQGQALAGEIVSIAEPGREYKLMEVCGRHSHSIYKYGVVVLRPANRRLVQSWGCPRRVVHVGRVDGVSGVGGVAAPG